MYTLVVEEGEIPMNLWSKAQEPTTKTLYREFPGIVEPEP